LIFQKKDSCKVSNQFKNKILNCFDEYSTLNYEKNYYDFNWQNYNSSYSSNVSFTNIYSAFQYTEPSQINSYPYTGVRNTYLGGGYVFKMKEDSSLLDTNE
jgi:hypothetical protein